MATEVKLSRFGVTFATRERAGTLVAELPATGELRLDFDGVRAASPSFVDGLVGALSERADRVEITGLTAELERLVMRVVTRRDASSQFRFLARA